MKPKSQTLLLTLLFLTLNSPLWGQLFTEYNTGNSGLPYNTVNALALGPDTALWVGTEFGLAKFHHGSWTVWQSANSDLPVDAVRSLAADSAGLWLGTSSGGLSRLEGATWTTFSSFNSPIPDDQVRAIYRESESSLWIGTSGGLVHKQDTNWLVFNDQNSILQSNNIPALEAGTGNLLFVASVNGGLTEVVDTPLVLHNINTGLPDNTISDIAVDAVGNPYLATPAGGLGIKNGNTWTVLLASNSGIPSNHLTAVEFDSGGQLWIGSFAHGLTKFKTQPGPGPTWTWFDTTNGDLPDQRINCLLWDDLRGLLWIGTQSGGLVSLDPLALGSERGFFEIKKTHFYPNPGKDILRYQGQIPIGGKIRMFDLSGKIKEEFQWESEIDLSAFPAGIYLLEGWQNGGRIFREKLILQK